MFFMSTALISFTASFILPMPDIASALNALVSTHTPTLTLHYGVSLIASLTSMVRVVFQELISNLDTLGVEFVVIHALKLWMF